MANRPPLTETIVIAMARLVDDAQNETREPSHSNIEFQIDNANLVSGDPARQGGKPVGKFKRIRGTLSWALSNNLPAGEALVMGLISTVKGCGGFRTASSNYCGEEAIANLTAAFSSQGWELFSDGTLQPRLLESLTGRALTSALLVYAERARRGYLDSPLLAGTAKDLLEATAAHVLVQKWGRDPGVANFPMLLGQAFTALDFATPTVPITSGEPAEKRVQRAAFELGCSLNALRNKQGTGHGHPWISTVNPSQARFSIESMGNIASLMLDALVP